MVWVAIFTRMGTIMKAPFFKELRMDMEDSSIAMAKITRDKWNLGEPMALACTIINTFTIEEHSRIARSMEKVVKEAMMVLTISKELSIMIRKTKEFFVMEKWPMRENFSTTFTMEMANSPMKMVYIRESSKRESNMVMGSSSGLMAQPIEANSTTGSKKEKGNTIMRRTAQ